MTGDRGANALAGVLHEIHSWDTYSEESEAADILGTTGLFIADVTKHEPGVYNDGASWLGCSCGWEDTSDESYFDHLVEP